MSYNISQKLDTDYVQIIIIITDEKIRVTLSRECCKGTVHSQTEGVFDAHTKRGLVKQMHVTRKTPKTPIILANKQTDHKKNSP